MGHGTNRFLYLLRAEADRKTENKMKRHDFGRMFVYIQARRIAYK